MFEELRESLERDRKLTRRSYVIIMHPLDKAEFINSFPLAINLEIETSEHCPRDHYIKLDSEYLLSSKNVEIETLSSCGETIKNEYETTS